MTAQGSESCICFGQMVVTECPECGRGASVSLCPTPGHEPRPAKREVNGVTVIDWKCVTCDVEMRL